MSKPTYLFVISNGKAGAGELDYMKALENALADQSHASANIMICKRTLNAFHENEADITKLPNSPYDAVPTYTPDLLDGLSTPTHVIGVGNSTLATMLDIQSDLKERHIECDASYITHLVNHVDDLKKLVDNDVTIFAPSSYETLSGINADLADKAKLVAMDAVPHTNSHSSCIVEYMNFMAAKNGEHVKDLLSTHTDFAFAVINAGYGVGETKEHIPYTKLEALEHGFALGRQMKTGTALIAAHGGPRNLVDEKEFGQPTLDSFVEGYVLAQSEKGPAPVIITERFEKGLPYNIIKAGYMLAQESACKAFISNAEGYGTMDGAMLHIDNKEKLLGMFPFDALSMDPTGQRQKNIDDYNERGIAVLGVTSDGNMHISHHPQMKETTGPQKDAAEMIIETLEMSQFNKPSIKSRLTP